MKFLVIRTDNIGDLICTTPLLSALRKHYSEAHIAAFVNSYNAPVLENNTDVNVVYAYTKGKHTHNVFYAYWKRFLLMIKLRRECFDYAILAGSGFKSKGLKLARQVKARHIIGYVESKTSLSKYVNLSVPYLRMEMRHEVEDTFALLQQLNIFGNPPSLSLVPTFEIVKAIQINFRKQFFRYINLVPIGIHISARKPSNRWSEDSYIELIQILWKKHQLPFMLFWSPGSESNPMHPGDDEKASRIMAGLKDVPVFACATQKLSELIAGLSLTRAVICSDGGAMHIAAALGKPIVCFFGNSIVKHWYPWGVKHVVLQPASLNVADVTVSEALIAYEALHESI